MQVRKDYNLDVVLQNYPPLSTQQKEGGIPIPIVSTAYKDRLAINPGSLFDNSLIQLGFDPGTPFLYV